MKGSLWMISQSSYITSKVAVYVPIAQSYKQQYNFLDTQDIASTFS